MDNARFMQLSADQNTAFAEFQARLLRHQSPVRANSRVCRSLPSP